VYAWGVIGSIVGTFATGFWLIAAFGTAAIIWAVAGALAAMALLFGVGSLKAAIWGGVLVVLAALGTGPWAWAHDLGATLALREVLPPNVVWADESQYSSIQIVRVQDDPEKRDMHLDKLLHSSILLEDPLNHQYSYERVYSAITRSLVGERDSLNTLTIGGGGYTFPRWLEALWPKSRTEVVEIDPAVTKAALAAFGLPANHGLVIHHEDGRAFLNGLAARKAAGESVPPYDFVYLDAVNDYSVPYQLTTVECVREIHDLLAPNGAFLMNMIDVFEEGLFLGSMVETMKQVFPEVEVLVEGNGVQLTPDLRETFIVAGTKQPVDWRAVVIGYEGSAGLYIFRGADLARLRDRSGGALLSDDWAPIENLLAPVVGRSSRNVAASALVQQAQTALRTGRRADAMKACERALEFAPNHPDALTVLANIQLEGGNFGRAIELYQRILERHPDSFSARLNLARAFLKQRHLDAAEKVLREAPHGAAESPLTLNNLGTIAAARGQYEEATAQFRGAIERKPDYLEARLNLALSLLKMDRVDEAVAELQRILAIAPDHRQARQVLQGIASVREG
jgi:Tfp pilus assembly protein PilF/spermidine synthase